MPNEKCTCVYKQHELLQSSHFSEIWRHTQCRKIYDKKWRKENKHDINDWKKENN